METVVGDMQAAQEKAFTDARAALAAGFSGQRTTFYNSLTRDAAAFNDSLNNNFNAFVESLNAQRAAFNNSLAEKQAAFDAAKARKLKQIHFVHDSNYKFHLIKLLEAKAAAITQAIGGAREFFSNALAAEQEAFKTFRESERTAFDEARQALRDGWAEAEVEAEGILNTEIEVRGETFDNGLDAASESLANRLAEQREHLKGHLTDEYHEAAGEYEYTEHVKPDAEYSPYSHSANTKFLQ